ncbi:hypothetical protein [Euzebya tangerina]|uniref:hypothetical protein n=1 Tax=Euzebya tangerina TaxID=591198 RepID=UPI000E31D307|nr:hypothetical protein [Euzebya tangerina]
MSLISRDDEVAVGRLLGLDDEAARAVVSTLEDQGWLTHGVATVSTALAARWGVEMAAAARDVADGRRLGAAFSDFELRAAAEEAESDLVELVASYSPADDSSGSHGTDRKEWSSASELTRSPFHVGPTTPAGSGPDDGHP